MAVWLAGTNLAVYAHEILRQQGLEPRALILEITESALLAGTAVGAAIERHEGLAIDDVGTGYSSLSHPEAFPGD